MTISLAYGKGELPLELPDDLRLSVVRPRYRPAVEDPHEALRAALRTPTGSPPLREFAAGARRVGIVVNDLTRATPNSLIVGAIVQELDSLDDSRIVLFNATGTHRTNTREELEKMLGPEALGRFTVIQNNASSSADHRSVGVARSGNDIRIHRELLACDVKILTGFIEPHFFAGFSGGGKAMMPGMAELSTILHNHRAQNMDHEKATWGVTEGNPVYEEVREAATMVEGCFLLNVALNRNKAITAVFAGDVAEAHRQGCAYVGDSSMVQVPAAFDLVITSNSGYPLDLNLYQSVKGMSAAAGIVKPGGAIIVASECWDGVPAHGAYGRLLSEAQSPTSLLERIRAEGFHEQDMWQAQIHAKILEKAEVYFYSDTLSEAQLRSAFLKPCRSIHETVDRLRHERGQDLSVCILPEGPVTVPYFR